MSHRINDEIGLALARRVAEELRACPEKVQIARDNLSRWAVLNAHAPRLMACYREWQEILERPLEGVLEVMLAETDEGQRLRQNSPFPGVLSPREVWEIKRRVRSELRPA